MFSSFKPYNPKHPDNQYLEATLEEIRAHIEIDPASPEYRERQGKVIPPYGHIFSLYDLLAELTYLVFTKVDSPLRGNLEFDSSEAASDIRLQWIAKSDFLVLPPVEAGKRIAKLRKPHPLGHLLYPVSKLRSMGGHAFIADASKRILDNQNGLRWLLENISDERRRFAYNLYHLSLEQKRLVNPADITRWVNALPLPADLPVGVVEIQDYLCPPRTRPRPKSENAASSQKSEARQSATNAPPTPAPKPQKEPKSSKGRAFFLSCAAVIVLLAALVFWMQHSENAQTQQPGLSSTPSNTVTPAPPVVASQVSQPQPKLPPQTAKPPAPAPVTPALPQPRQISDADIAGLNLEGKLRLSNLPSVQACLSASSISGLLKQVSLSYDGKDVTFGQWYVTDNNLAIRFLNLDQHSRQVIAPTYEVVHAEVPLASRNQWPTKRTMVQQLSNQALWEEAKQIRSVNPNRSASLLALLCAFEFASAFRELAEFHYSSSPAEKRLVSFEQVLDLLSRGSQHGELEAMIMLGKIFMQPRSSTYQWHSNLEKTLRKIPEVDAKYRMNQALQTTFAPRMGITLFMAASERNFAPADYSLGKAYATGSGVNQNWETAAKYYQRAATKQHSRAQFELAVCYQNGHGLTQNLDQAEAWYRTSARNGYSNAQTICDANNWDYSR